MSFLSTCATHVQAEKATRTIAPRQFISEETLAKRFFGNDQAWYLENIPFLDIDDAEIERVYYYRWRVFRAHIREIGAQGTDETEFLNNVPWARQPYTDLNDSSSFHIMDGRWLRDPRYVESIVTHLYEGGGNDRHFSESIAAATYAWTQVTGDPTPALRQLDTMRHVYNLWDDHFDAQRGLYWIEPLLDATEYTISSIDASGAGFTDAPSHVDSENGFTGGYAFRPSINSYQFANAKAIANLERLSGHEELAAEYDQRAENLRTATLLQLWNPKLEHFTDVYQRSTPFVTAGTFIRGRELVGFVPWMYELPPVSANENAGEQKYETAWKHALSSNELGGEFGLRTVEPSYPKYLHQYRYDKETGKPECQWNGTSWPFQTSQALTGMANLLHDYQQQIVTNEDYVRLLRQYTRQHIFSDGRLDLQEDYNPDTGLPIVGLPRSHHYNHSTYLDLILTGLIGIRPHTEDVLELHPLLPASNGKERPIRYFALQNLRYHGHHLSIVYDETGEQYHVGRGLSVFEGSRRLAGPVALQRTIIPLQQVSRDATPSLKQIDVAVNVWNRPPSAFEPELPIVTVSPAVDEAHMYEAVDGRAWFFPEVPNGWSPEVEASSTGDGLPEGVCEFTVDLRHAKPVQLAELYFLDDGKNIHAPAAYRLQAERDGTWHDVASAGTSLHVPIANAVNSISFQPLTAARFRLVVTPPKQGRFRLVEFKLLRRRH